MAVKSFGQISNVENTFQAGSTGEMHHAQMLSVWGEHYVLTILGTRSSIVRRLININYKEQRNFDKFLRCHKVELKSGDFYIKDVNKLFLPQRRSSNHCKYFYGLKKSELFEQ